MLKWTENPGYPDEEEILTKIIQFLPGKKIEKRSLDADQRHECKKEDDTLETALSIEKRRSISMPRKNDARLRLGGNVRSDRDDLRISGTTSRRKSQLI